MVGDAILVLFDSHASIGWMAITILKSQTREDIQSNLFLASRTIRIYTPLESKGPIVPVLRVASSGSG